ncbi:MAG: response regulator transcription factor [Bacteroidales bacterium]|nr:response regulator transcription factor [Bacteroidales bacterium]
MIKSILIIEDEAVAADNLKRLLAKVLPEATVVGTTQSIEESVEWFEANPMPDLCLMDIHLADGSSFRIFDKVRLTCPIIFSTAYDQYALDAFKVNSIDYLLKPISVDDLRRAVGKLNQLSAASQSEAIARLGESMRRYRSHFLVPVRDKLIPIEVREVACFYLEDKISRAIMYDGHQQTIDKPLDSIMEQLDPSHFFRANRQFIVAHKAIREISVWPISKLSITLSVPTPERIIISKARVQEFKTWYTQ